MQRFGLIFLSTAIILTVWLRPVAAQTAQDKITLGTITLSVNNLPIYVAWDNGFFANENLFVDAVVPKVLQLLIEDATMRPPLPKPDKYIDMSYLEEAKRAAQ